MILTRYAARIFCSCGLVIFDVSLVREVWRRLLIETVHLSGLLGLGASMQSSDGDDGDHCGCLDFDCYLANSLAPDD